MERKNRKSGRLRLDDVAALAGVSPMTASRVLRQTGQVSEELAERVRQAAAHLNYVPDPAAQALASARSASIGVLVPALSNAVFADLLEAVHQELFPEGFQVLIGNTHYAQEQEEKLLHNFLSYRPSGLIVTSFDHSPLARKLIENSGVPCVHVMETKNDDNMYCVGFSQQKSAQAVADYLVSCGRRRIGFIGASMDTRAQQRLEGFRQALLRHNLHDMRLESFDPAPTSTGLGALLFAELVARHPDIDAIFLNNDDLAHGALFEAARLGIRVPEDIAIVGFNDVEQSAHTMPRLTTVRTPRAEIGRQAARMLLNLIRGHAVSQRAIDLGFELIVRESA